MYIYVHTYIYVLYITYMYVYVCMYVYILFHYGLSQNIDDSSPALYCGTLFIHSIYNSSHLLIPHSHSYCLPLPLSWQSLEEYVMLHEFACHPCSGAILIFSVSFQFVSVCAAKANTVLNHSGWERIDLQNLKKK